MQQSLSQNGTTVASYTWLADGTKCAVVDNTTNGYDYLGSLIYSRSGSVRTLESAAFGGGRFVNTNNTILPYYYITDHLGSTRVITDNSGNVVERNDYYPFGGKHANPSYAQLTINKQKFNGKELQTTGNTGFLDYGARMYDDVTGRWGVVDPMAEKYTNISSYAYVANNPIRNIDPDGRVIVDAAGKTITYSARTGWSSNVTPDVRQIGTAMMATPKGTEMFNKMMNARHNITITIDPGKGDGTRNGFTSSTKSGDNIGSANIVIYKEMAEQTVNDIQTVKTALDNGGQLKDIPGAEMQALLENPPINAYEQMANVASHEAEHATNKAANANFEPNKSKREAIADQTQIEVIKQTPAYRLEKIELKPAVITQNNK